MGASNDKFADISIIFYQQYIHRVENIRSYLIYFCKSEQFHSIILFSIFYLYGMQNKKLAVIP